MSEGEVKLIRRQRCETCEHWEHAEWWGDWGNCKNPENDAKIRTVMLGFNKNFGCIYWVKRRSP
jgi:hypothetical protein